MPRCDKNFRFACAQLGGEECRSELGGANRFFVWRRADTLMPLHESEAIVLQSYPLGEADRLVSFLSRSMGRVRGVASGARRTKSRFGSTLERLSHIRIWFYEKQNARAGAHQPVRNDRIVSRCVSRLRFERGAGAFQRNDRDGAAGPRSLPTRIFVCCCSSRRRLSTPASRNCRWLILSLWTVKLGGWLPTLDACARCGKKLDAKEAAYFSPSASAIACGKCRKPGMRTLSPAVLAAARKMLGERLDRLSEEMISPRAARDLSDVMLDVIEHQIDRKLKSRELLESLA